MSITSPLAAPNLDDRRFQDLVDDAKRLVQQRCPEWTDHNVSDPGVTLIETFAFMTDQLLYRLNRVPDRLYLKFLELIGLRLRPPTPAYAPVTFWLSTPAESAMVIRTGTNVATVRTENDESTVFSTVEELEIPPCALTEVRVLHLDGEPSESVPVLGNLASRVPARMFSDRPRAGDALYLGLDRPVPRCAVRVDFDGRVEGIGVDPRNPPLEWEAWTGDGWEHCAVSLDETGGFNRPGAVVVHLPRRHDTSVVDGDAAAWVRVRVLESAEGQPRYNSPPIIDGLTASTVGGTVDAMHADVVRVEELGVAEGVAGQAFGLMRGPVLRTDGVVVETTSAGGWQPWEQVEDFSGSGPDDRHVVLDHAAGQVLFGPAVREPEGGVTHYGAVPDKGAVVRIRRYAVGGGRGGNVPVGAIGTLRSSIPFVARVENRQAAQGGVDGETVDEAKTRAPLLLRTRSRAVTVEDFEAFAREVAPDAARIHCVPSEDAGAGAVKLLVVPAAAADEGRVQFEDLVPRDEMLRRIAARLDEVRLIGTRLLIEPPLYRGITVVARVRARPRADVEEVRRTSLRALYTFLSPLPGGGPEGRGWPFGRPVQTGEVFAALQRVPGVDIVEEVRLFAANPVTGERGAESNRFEIERHSLVFSFDHHVRVEP